MAAKTGVYSRIVDLTIGEAAAGGDLLKTEQTNQGRREGWKGRRRRIKKTESKKERKIKRESRGRKRIPGWAGGRVSIGPRTA